MFESDDTSDPIIGADFERCPHGYIIERDENGHQFAPACPSLQCSTPDEDDGE